MAGSAWNIEIYLMIALTSSPYCSVFRAFMILTVTASMICDLSLTTSESTSATLAAPPAPPDANLAVLGYGMTTILILLFWNDSLILIFSSGLNLGTFTFSLSSN